MYFSLNFPDMFPLVSVQLFVSEPEVGNKIPFGRHLTKQTSQG